MSHKIRIEFMDGTGQTVDSYETYVQDGVLWCRTSHNTSYNRTYERFPLVNIKAWKNE